MTKDCGLGVNVNSKCAHWFLLYCYYLKKERNAFSSKWNYLPRFNSYKSAVKHLQRYAHRNAWMCI